MSSSGPYGVYHSVFDNFAWFKKFGDPDFVYEQEMARVFGLEAVRMADADVLPYDYEEYGKEIAAYLDAARSGRSDKFGDHALDFGAVNAAAHHFQSAGAKILAKQKNPPRDATRLNQALRGAERALLVAAGTAASSLVSPCDLRAGRIHGLRGGSDSGSERSPRQGRQRPRAPAVGCAGRGARTRRENAGRVIR